MPPATGEVQIRITGEASDLEDSLDRAQLTVDELVRSIGDLRREQRAALATENHILEGQIAEALRGKQAELREAQLAKRARQTPSYTRPVRFRVRSGDGATEPHFISCEVGIAHEGLSIAEAETAGDDAFEWHGLPVTNIEWSKGARDLAQVKLTVFGHHVRLDAAP